jgi:hypothetical protein
MKKIYKVVLLTVLLVVPTFNTYAMTNQEQAVNVRQQLIQLLMLQIELLRGQLADLLKAPNQQFVPQNTQTPIPTQNSLPQGAQLQPQPPIATPQTPRYVCVMKNDSPTIPLRVKTLSDGKFGTFDSNGALIAEFDVLVDSQDYAQKKGEINAKLNKSECNYQ